MTNEATTGNIRKLTPTQQEVVDMMADGWELATSMDLYSHAWLQQGGAGSGGRSKDVSLATVRRLDYLGYIEMNEAKYPVKTWCLKGEKVVTPEVQTKEDELHGDYYQHPSYGTISFSACYGGKSAVFGSNIEHNSLIRIAVHHAEKHITNSVERVHSTSVIAEAYMTPTQFADAITHAGSGGESPITLQFTEKDGKIEQPEFVNKRRQFEREFYRRADAIIAQLQQTIEKAKDKNSPKWIVGDLEVAVNWLKKNIPFLAEQFAEQMDDTVSEAKNEVEAYVSRMIQEHGLNHLEDTSPRFHELTGGEETSHDNMKHPGKITPLDLPS